MVFDAATTGRMGLVFYQELAENEYLQNNRLASQAYIYFLTAWKYEKQEKVRQNRYSSLYGAPSYDDILYAVYGKERGDKSYNVLKKKVRKQLLEQHLFGSFPFKKHGRNGSKQSIASNVIHRFKYALMRTELETIDQYHLCLD